MRRISIGLRLTICYLGIFALAQLIFGLGMWFILRESLHEISSVRPSRRPGSRCHSWRDYDRIARSPACARRSLENTVPKRLATTCRSSTRTVTGSTVLRYFLGGVCCGRSSECSVSHFTKTRSFASSRFGLLTKTSTARSILCSTGPEYPVQRIETLTRFRNYLLMFAVPLLLVAGTVGYWLSRRASFPVDTLTRTARTITGPYFEQPPRTTPYGDELQRLSDTLNQMLRPNRNRLQPRDRVHCRRVPRTAHADLPDSHRGGSGASALSVNRNTAKHCAISCWRQRALPRWLRNCSPWHGGLGRQALNIQPIDLRGTLQEVASGWRQVANVRGLQFSEEFWMRNSRF